jgi:hypothetical protein
LAVGFALVIGVLLASGASAAELRNPRLQRSLQALEVARAQLDAAIHQYPPELRQGAERTAREVDAAAHAITDELSVQRTPRQIEPGRAVATDRPVRAARDALRQAMDELTRGVKEQDMNPRVHAAFERERTALDQADALARREAALPPVAPPPAVEMRHPRLQKAIQLLEIARAHLDAARSRSPREWREEIDRTAREVDAAGQESAAALSAAGAPRTIGPARVAASDHPLRAAGDALRQANAELAAVAGDEFRGHVRGAIDHARRAMDQLEGLARREEGRR